MERLRGNGPASDMQLTSKGYNVSVSQWQVYRATTEEIIAGDGALDERIGTQGGIVQEQDSCAFEKRARENL